MIAHRIDANGFWLSTIDATVEQVDADPTLIARPLKSWPSELRPRWDGRGWTFVNPERDIEAERARKWADIKSTRSQREYGGFEWEGLRFDSDPESQRRLMSAIQMAAMVTDFAVDWTLENNEVASLDSGDLQSLGSALAAHVNAVHEWARQKREFIATASLEELDAMT